MEYEVILDFIIEYKRRIKELELQIELLEEENQRLKENR